MQVAIPLYIETIRASLGNATLHQVRPLFFQAPVRADEELSRAQQRLIGDLQQQLVRLGRELRHDLLMAWNFGPPIEQHRLDLLIDLRRRTARGRFFFAVFESLGRKLAFCPSIPTLWFEITRGQTIGYRAAQSLTHHFRKLEQDAEHESDVRPEDFCLNGTAWVTTVDLDIDVAQSFKGPENKLMAILGGADVTNGADELRKCGRCLNWLYPSGLSPALLRDREVSELGHRLTSADRRPVLLLGRRMSGKTAIVHEYVSRRTAKRSSPYSSSRNVWLMSPQRLVSGMSFVGQWESRLLAILKEANKRNHILYFDDLPGLLQAGKSRDSSLNMAQVMRPYLERREVRVLAEITPESWRVLREQDRGLTDLFDVLPVDETDTETTARVVLAARRSLEQEFRCRFALDALPAVLEIERRYSTDAAFPGKAVAFLKELALIGRGGEVNRNLVWDEFHRRSGLSSQFLDPRHQLQRAEIHDALAGEVIGQSEPVAAVADILSIAKARMNDMGRPMGSLLFIGPTGVGKTQLAKAAAQFLFGDASRLLRFDLNEFLDRGSAARLVGTFERPDGLLTGAVRRQPFAVILFDEIEKGHPEVFDLLLQVLGEGRLSDGLGRTISFSNAVIIMTSNLGVRENLQRVGFGADAPTGDHVWQKAVQQFFRPEFFNRIDRIVPFQRLDRAAVEKVATIALNEILKRDGLARRKCLLSIEQPALDLAIDRGYSPELGARALKRCLEQLLVMPASRQLAAMSPNSLTRLHLYPSANGIAINVQSLQNAAAISACVAQVEKMAPEQAQRSLDQFLVRIEAALTEFQPTGPISAGAVDERQHAYFQLQERCRRLRHLSAVLNGLSQTSAQIGRHAAIPSGTFRHARKIVPRRRDAPQSFFADLAREEADTESLHESLRELFDQADPSLESDERLRSILHEAAMAETELQSLRANSPTRIGVAMIALGLHATGSAVTFADWWRILFQPSRPDDLDLGIDCRTVEVSVVSRPTAVLLELSGIAAHKFAASESGLHLHYAADGQMRLHHLIPFALGHEESVSEAWVRLAEARSAWLERLGCGEADLAQDPWNWGTVNRLYESSGLTLDFRTGEMIEGTPNVAAMRRFVLGALPVPAEFAVPKEAE